MDPPIGDDRTGSAAQRRAALSKGPDLTMGTGQDRSRAVMDVLPTLAQIVAVFSVTILPFVLIIWFLAGRDPDPVSDVMVSPRTPWPHGVQEEDPRPWRFAQDPC
jgi:hypothetical protein